MANDNKNINELVSEEDEPTAELETPVLSKKRLADEEHEADAKTFDASNPVRKSDAIDTSVSELKSDLITRTETISRLQFDIEQLRSKWMGLESEIKAREELTARQNGELDALRGEIASLQRTISNRDDNIGSLRSEITQRDEINRGLNVKIEELQLSLGQAEQSIAEAAERKLLAPDDSQLTELNGKLQRSEEYADLIRQQLQDSISASARRQSNHDEMAQTLSEQTLERDELAETLRTTESYVAKLKSDLTAIEAKHDNEIRTLRFELGEAQTTVVESETLNNQLSSELVSTLGAKGELEQKLDESEIQSDTRMTAMHLELELLAAKRDEDIHSIQAELRDALGDGETKGSANERLQAELAEALESSRRLEQEFADATHLSEAQIGELRAELKDLNNNHEDEVRDIRLAMEQVQQTLDEKDQINERLMAELTDSHNINEDLEHTLASTEKLTNEQISELEKNIKKFTNMSDEYEEKLQTKTDAVNALIAELEKKTEQIESIDHIEGVIHEIDNRMSERIDAEENRVESETESNRSTKTERITRLLVGSIDGQVLRFPLFKDRLTIGRNEDNDIQLNANYISRRHAVIQTEGEATRIIDWGSKNGVYVNSQKVKEHFLQDRDIVAIGNARFRYDERKKRDS